MSMTSPLRVTEATEEDVPLILQFIREHAEYEKALDRLTASEDHLLRALFGPQPCAEVLIARAGEEPAGFAMFYFSCSSYTALPNLYLEDIFVRPSFRGSGVGKKLLALLHVAPLSTVADEWNGACSAGTSRQSDSMRN